jgi:hypothetical protein
VASHEARLWVVGTLFEQQRLGLRRSRLRLPLTESDRVVMLAPRAVYSVRSHRFNTVRLHGTA